MSSTWLSIVTVDGALPPDTWTLPGKVLFGIAGFLFFLVPLVTPILVVSGGATIGISTLFSRICSQGIGISNPEVYFARGILMIVPSVIVGIFIIVPSFMVIWRLRLFSDKNSFVMRHLAKLAAYNGILLISAIVTLVIVSFVPVNSSFLSWLLVRILFVEILNAWLRVSLAFGYRYRATSQESSSSQRRTSSVALTSGAIPL